MKQGEEVYPTDIELVIAAENGDIEAYETLMQRYKTKIFACLHFHLYDYDHEWDIYQDAWIKGLTEIRDHKYKVKPNKTFWSWYKSLIINLIIDEARRDKLFEHHMDYTVKSYSGNPVHNDFDEDTAYRELVYEWTQQMNEPMCTIMRKRLLDGSEYEEIAEQLNIPVGNVKVAVSRAKKKAARTMHLTAWQLQQLGLTDSVKTKKNFQHL